ncbi:hypothetical protein Tco_0250972 [Tanacetum coccineum]
MVACYTDAGYLTDVDDKAEYIAASNAVKEAVWIRKFIFGLGVVPTSEEPMKMYCDNNEAITKANESGITKGARHYRAKVHYLREVIEFDVIVLEKVHTDDNVANPFTKALPFNKHSKHTMNIGNSQVKDNIDLLVQQYEQFTIPEEESIDSGFARFNTIITSLKALDEGFSSKNYVRKFLRALHPKWRLKVTTIKESKDLSSLALDELIGNLKVQEVDMEKDSKIYRGKKERVKSIALKAKKESSDDETLTSGSDDEEYAMAVRNFKKVSLENGKFVRHQ